MKYYLILAEVIVITIIPSIAQAYLGGFENTDGYEPFLNDVATYNAGQYGANAGGGIYTNITPNTGLWKKLQGPLFPAQGTTGSVSYTTGHQFRDRTSPNTAAQALVITTNADGWNGGPQEYSYMLDSFDLGNINPANTGGSILQVSFWSCSKIFGLGEGGGLGIGSIGNNVSFYDSMGNLGFELGYLQPGITTDFAATNVGNGWQQSQVSVDPSTYHRWDVILDLIQQTISIDIFESGSLTSLISNAPLMASMDDLTELRFLGTPGVNNAKVWSLDDFDMSVKAVPEPATLELLILLWVMGVVFRNKYS